MSGVVAGNDSDLALSQQALKNLGSKRKIKGFTQPFSPQTQFLLGVRNSIYIFLSIYSTP